MTYLWFLSWDPFKSHEIAPLSTTSSGLLHTNQCYLDKHFRVTDTRHSGFSMRLGFECEFILKDDISQS